MGAQQGAARSLLGSTVAAASDGAAAVDDAADGGQARGSSLQVPQERALGCWSPRWSASQGC